MKSLSSVIAIGAIAFGLADPAFASAYKFNNIGSFTAKGSMTVTSIAISIPCQAKLTGVSDGSGTTITGATFTGATCIAVSPSGLPWALRADGPHSLSIRDVTVRAAILGICGPGGLKSQLTKLGKITISGASLPSSLGVTPCSVSATLSTSPQLEIIPRH
jgi:hypothetical protein